MKKHLIVLAFIIAINSFESHAQRVVEQIMGTQQSYSPLFGNEAANLSVMFVMSYSPGLKDSVFSVVFEVNATKTQSQGGAVSFGVFGRNLAGSASSYYSIDRKKGNLIFDYNKFDTVVRYFNQIVDYTKQNYGRNRILMYSMDNFKISMEIFYRGGDDPKLAYDRFYYLSIDDATFRLKQDQFLDLTKGTINEIKSSWDEYNTSKLLPALKY